MNRLCPRFSLACWSVLVFCAWEVVLCGASPPPAPAEKPKARTTPGGAEAAEKIEQTVYRLRYLKATEAARILRELVGEGGSDKGSLRLTVETTTNSLLASGRPALLVQLEAILKRIDTEDAGEMNVPAGVRVFSLGGLEPDLIEDALRLVFGERSTSRVTLNKQQRVVLASTDPVTVATVERILREVADVARERVGPPVEVQVRLYWLASARNPRDASRLPDHLKDVTAELATLGLEKVRLAGQLAISTQLNAPFETSGTAQLDASYRVSLTGSVTAEKVNVVLDLTDTARTARSATRAGSLRTQVTLTPGRPVLLGVIPTGAQTSAFILQIEGKRPGGPAGPRPPKGASFEFRDAPWQVVLKWLTDQTGLPVVTSVEPRGNFTFVSPRPGKTYTVPEIIDVLNEALAAQKALLVRRPKAIALVATDAKLELGFVERLSINELDTRGRTELVSVAIPLRGLAAADIAPEVKKLLGPLGQVVAVRGGLVLQDSAGTLRRVNQLIQDLEKAPGRKAPRGPRGFGR